MVSVFVSGSFKDHYEDLERKSKEFEKAGFTVVSPRGIILAPTSDVNLLKGYYDRDAARAAEKRIALSDKMDIEDRLRKADALFIYNPDQRMDVQSSLRLGLALMQGKPVFVEREPEDITLREYCQAYPVNKIMENISKVARKEASSLADVHNYIREDGGL